MRRRVCEREHCRHGNAIGASHCARCGSSLTQQLGDSKMLWSKCGHLVRDDARFCARCGVPFDTTAPDSKWARRRLPRPQRKQSWGSVVIILVVIWFVLKSC